MQYGPERDRVDLSLAIPSECAARLGDGRADCGLVPAIELIRQPLSIVCDLGIVSHAAVRSILLISKVPLHRIGSLAVDASSRTSVMLCRLLLRQMHRCQPALTAMPPNLAVMLASHDAALLIGDPALRIDLDALPYAAWDLGAAWTEWTGLPMVFAAWASPVNHAQRESLGPLLRSSYTSGLQHFSEIVRAESEQRNFPPGLVEKYLGHQIRYEIGPLEQRGLARFLEEAKALDAGDSRVMIEKSHLAPQ